MRKLKEKLFLKEYDEEKIKIANKTARASGASALNKDGSIRSVVGRYVLDNVSKDASILDFGSGPAAVQTLALRDAGFKNVSAYDFGVNTRDGIQDPDALNKKYDVVFASNVLNVSSDEEMLRETLRDIKKAAKNEIVFNYPSSPRKSGLNAQEVKDIIIDEYGVEPELVSGTKSAPVWKVLLNNSKNISEDTVKTRDGKWTNRGDSGETHGEFRTKKQADAQRKAIYASGWKKESVEDLANRVRKNDLEWDDEIEASYAEDGDVAVQFQDRETLTHEVTPYRSRRPRVSSNTWGRIWKNGDLVYNERGPKYKVRDDVIKKLNSMNESFENDSLEEDWSKGLSFTFKITTNSLQNAFKNGSVRVGGQNKADLSSMYGDTSLRFKIVGKPYSSANDGYINVDRNESELHVNLYDKDFTYKEFGGKSNFNKAKLTQEMEELKNSIENDLKDAGLVITQSKVEVGGSPKFDTTWRQAQKYNEDLDLSDDKDFDTYSNFNSDLYNTMSDVVYDYSSKGISKKDIEKAVEWFLTHFFDDYDEDKLEENKHIKKAKSYASQVAEEESLSELFGKKKKSKDDWTVGFRDENGKFKGVSYHDSKESAIKDRDQLQKDHPDIKYIVISGNKRDESLNESDDVWSTPESAAKSLFDRGLVASDYVERACKRHGKDQNFAYEVGVIISQLIEEDEHLGESKSTNEDKLVDKLKFKDTKYEGSRTATFSTGDDFIVTINEDIDDDTKDLEKYYTISIHHPRDRRNNYSVDVGDWDDLKSAVIAAKEATDLLNGESCWEDFNDYDDDELVNTWLDSQKFFVEVGKVYIWVAKRISNKKWVDSKVAFLLSKADRDRFGFNKYGSINESKSINEGIDSTLNKLGGPAAFRRELMATIDAYPGIEDDAMELADMMYGGYEDVVSIWELEDAIEYMIDDVLESTEAVNSSYSPELLNELVNYYSSFDTMSYEEIWDEIVLKYNNKNLANDVIESLDNDEEDSEDEFLGESKSINEDMSEEDYDEFFSIVDKIGPAINTAGGDMDDINGNLSHPYEDEDRIKIVFVSTVDKKDAKKFVKTVDAEIEKALQTTRFNRVRDIYVYQLSDNDLQMRVPASLRGEFSKKFSMFEIDIRASADL